MDYLKVYADFLKSFLKVKRSMKVVFDCSNGTTGLVLKELFRTTGPIQIKLINQKPDPEFSAHGPNPLAVGALRDLERAVKKGKADLGVIFDADGDRVFFVDDRGREVRHDATALLLSQDLTGTIVLTPLSGFLIREEIKKRGVKIFESRVGHYFIKKTMMKYKAVFAGEISGHFYFRDNFYADSGIFAAIKVINQTAAIMDQWSRLSDWVDSLSDYHRIPETNFKIKDKGKAMRKIEKHFRTAARHIFKRDGLKMEFDTGRRAWWFNLRPSNTEDLLRLNLEAKDKKILTAKLAELKKLIKN